MMTIKYNKSFDNPLFDSMIESLDFEKLVKSLKKKKYSYLWLIEIYYYSYMCLSNFEEKSYYYNLKKLFFDNIDFFAKTEKQIIFNNLSYYCLQKAEMGNSEFYREEFLIVKEMLKDISHSSSDNEYLNVIIYRNIMLLALRLKEYDWLEEFAADYTKKLKPEFRENLKYLVKANLSFACGEYEQALENINKIKYNLFLFKLDVKNLMLKIYYELNLFDQAFSLVDAYKHFLTSNKDNSETFKLQYGNFIALYTKLIKAKAKRNPDDAVILMNEVNNTDKLASRIWLRDKISEFIEKK